MQADVVKIQHVSFGAHVKQTGIVEVNELDIFKCFLFQIVCKKRQMEHLQLERDHCRRFSVDGRTFDETPIKDLQSYALACGINPYQRKKKLFAALNRLRATYDGMIQQGKNSLLAHALRKFHNACVAVGNETGTDNPEAPWKALTAKELKEIAKYFFLDTFSSLAVDRMTKHELVRLLYGHICGEGEGEPGAGYRPSAPPFHRPSAPPPPPPYIPPQPPSFIPTPQPFAPSIFVSQSLSSHHAYPAPPVPPPPCPPCPTIDMDRVQRLQQERDDLQRRLHSCEEQLRRLETERNVERTNLQQRITQLEKSLRDCNDRIGQSQLNLSQLHKNELESKDSKIRSLESDILNLQQQLRTQQQTTQDLQLRYDALDRKSSELNQQLLKQQSMQTSADDKHSENTVLRNQINQLNQDNANLRNQLTQTQSKNVELDAKLRTCQDLKQTIQDLQLRFTALQQQVQAKDQTINQLNTRLKVDPSIEYNAKIEEVRDQWQQRVAQKDQELQQRDQNINNLQLALQQGLTNFNTEVALRRTLEQRLIAVEANRRNCDDKLNQKDTEINRLKMERQQTDAKYQKLIIQMDELQKEQESLITETKSRNEQDIKLGEQIRQSAQDAGKAIDDAKRRQEETLRQAAQIEKNAEKAIDDAKRQQQDMQNILGDIIQHLSVFREQLLKGEVVESWDALTLAVNTILESKTSIFPQPHLLPLPRQIQETKSQLQEELKKTRAELAAKTVELDELHQQMEGLKQAYDSPSNVFVQLETQKTTIQQLQQELKISHDMKTKYDDIITADRAKIARLLTENKNLDSIIHQLQNEIAAEAKQFKIHDEELNKWYEQLKQRDIRIRTKLKNCNDQLNAMKRMNEQLLIQLSSRQTECKQLQLEFKQRQDELKNMIMQSRISQPEERPTLLLNRFDRLEQMFDQGAKVLDRIYQQNIQTENRLTNLTGSLSDTSSVISGQLTDLTEEIDQKMVDAATTGALTAASSLGLVSMQTTPIYAPLRPPPSAAPPIPQQMYPVVTQEQPLPSVVQPTQSARRRRFEETKTPLEIRQRPSKRFQRVQPSTLAYRTGGSVPIRGPEFGDLNVVNECKRSLYHKPPENDGTGDEKVRANRYGGIRDRYIGYVDTCIANPGSKPLRDINITLLKGDKGELEKMKQPENLDNVVRGDWSIYGRQLNEPLTNNNICQRLGSYIGQDRCRVPELRNLASQRASGSSSSSSSSQ